MSDNYVIIFKLNLSGTDCPSLRHLHRFKKEISKNWFDLGVELINDSVNELNNLQEDFPKDAGKCCSKMFQLWLKKSNNATWNQLIEALRVPNIEMFELANKIESMLFLGMYIYRYLIMSLSNQFIACRYCTVILHYSYNSL